MNKQRKRRLYWIAGLVLSLAVAATLVLYALRQNINLFYTPSQVQKGEAPQQRIFRMGGLVKPGSIQRTQEDLTIRFVVTDTANEVTVTYQGVLPDLFREGKGVVVQGKFDKENTFIAQEVLAKHDENYMPPQVRKALKEAHPKVVVKPEVDSKKVVEVRK